MNRKSFLNSLAPLFAGFSLHAHKASGLPVDDSGPDINIAVPPYLKKGDIIAITSPAGFITLEGIQPAVAKLREWGFEVRIGNTIGKRDFSFGGTDDERLLDFQNLLDDKTVKAILCARGGYGAVRIIDKIDFTKLQEHPKWIIGFSDITVIHSHLISNYKVAAIHSKMCNSFPDDWSLAEQVQKDTIESIRQCLTGEKMNYTVIPNPRNRAGICNGRLVGGNLKTLESLAGTPSRINANGRILFVEDTGEYLYSIDRMFWNLKRTGVLESLNGLIIGGFRLKKDDEGEEFGRTLEDIVMEKVKSYKYPVCFDFPVGHQKNNYALKCGLMHTLTAKENEVSLREL